MKNSLTETLKRASEAMAKLEKPMKRICMMGSLAWDQVFPPESPSQARRGGRTKLPSPEIQEAVFLLLGSKMGDSPADLGTYLAEAVKGGPERFQAMADAKKYLSDLPTSRSVFARHVIHAKRAWLEIDDTGAAPTKSKIRSRVNESIGGNVFYSDSSPEWSRVWSAAGLKDLPK